MIKVNVKGLDLVFVLHDSRGTLLLSVLSIVGHHRGRTLLLEDISKVRAACPGSIAGDGATHCRDLAQVNVILAEVFLDSPDLLHARNINRLQALLRPLHAKTDRRSLARQVNGHGEHDLCPDLRLTLNLDVATIGLDNDPRVAKADSDARDLAADLHAWIRLGSTLGGDLQRCDLAEWLEQRILLMSIHTDAGILDAGDDLGAV